MPHWSEYTRLTSLPAKSFRETGTFGTANFSPNCGEYGSNSDEKSSSMKPVKCAATCVELNTQNFASTDIWLVSTTSLRSHRCREAPANGATSCEPGNRLM